MPDRFFSPDFVPGAETIRLAGPEAHHLLHVLRGSVGDRVEVFDGRGSAALADIIGIERKAAELRVVEILPATPTPSRPLTLATAVPKGERFRWLVEKATELGVAALQPLETARSVVAPRGGKLDKMRQTVVGACKQCGRNDLMTIHDPQPWPDFLAATTEATALVVCCPNGRPLREAAIRSQGSGVRGQEAGVRSQEAGVRGQEAGGIIASIDDVRPLTIAIGPEGGFTADEMAAATAAGATVASLGSSILRIETAGVAVAAWAALALSRS